MFFMLVNFAILGTTLLILAYILKSINVFFFFNTGIKYIKPFPLVGNSLKATLGREHLNVALKRTYDSFPNEKYVGFFNFSQASIVIKDLDLLKMVTVKKFEHFVDHTVFSVRETDPLFYFALFNLKGERWREMRNTLSPAFTGSKMKEMIPFIEKCANRLITYLKENQNNPTINDYKEVELKDFLTKFTNDVIASCAFGIESDSLNDTNNKFYKMSEQLTQFEGLKITKFAGFFLSPRLMKFFKLRLMHKKITKFFRSTVKEIIEYRKQSGYVRRDMIHLLMQAVKGSLHDEKGTKEISDDAGFATVYEQKPDKRNIRRNTNWTDDEVAAQAVNFLFAGFDTVSTLLSFMVFELCLNRNVHDKLQAEIDRYVIDNNGSMASYNDLQKLKYLDMVCSETLRLWPPVGLVDRQCTKSIRLPPARQNHPGHTIRVGDVIQVPIFPIHRDPKYWPEPKKFDPERFSSENKSSIRPFTFLPFGVGPRSCIGNRFALMEIKLLVFYLLYHFDLVMTPKTENPLTIKNHIFTLTAKNGFWLGIRPRNNMK